MRKYWIWLFAFIILILAAADIKYKGLFYQLLPRSIQAQLDNLFI